jgi:hypothetical protein
MAVQDDEFETMLARARNFRRRADELRSVTGHMVTERRTPSSRGAQPVDYLTPAQRELAEEIVALLEDSRLSVLQAGQLERALWAR